MGQTARVTLSSTGQRGVAILTITVILLLVATIGTLVIGRVGLVEQKIVGTDVRSKEVYSAATGGLEYGVNWFSENFNSLGTWTDSNGDGLLDHSPAALANITLNADDYRHTITYSALTDLDPANDSMPVIVRVTSTAEGMGDTHISKTVSKEIMLGRTSIFSDTSGGPNLTSFAGPPLLIEGCIYDVTGTPDTFVPTPTSISIASTLGGAHVPCLDVNGHPAHLDQSHCADAACSSYVATGSNITKELGSQSLWQSIFGSTTKDELRALEKLQPTKLMIIDDAFPKYPGQPNLGPKLSGTYGSPTDPVILLIDKDSSRYCIGTNGGTVIYGILYYETPASGNGAGGCTMNGFGNVKIYGTLAKAGDLRKYNANIEVYGQDQLDFGGGGSGVGAGTEISLGLANPQFSEVFGTWRDY